MIDFNAEQARKIVRNVNCTELIDILDKIKSAAEEGGNDLHVDIPLKSKTISDLVIRGFKVSSLPSIATQKDGLYYVIKW